jgi:hypothetical protein
MKPRLLDTQGSILIEGCATLILVLFVLIIQIETIRRIWVGAAAQFAAFVSVRELVLGGNRSQNLFQIEKLIASALSDEKGHKDRKRISRMYWESTSNKKMNGRYQVKYPSLMRFREDGVSKFNFEVTERCHFPFLSR